MKVQKNIWKEILNYFWGVGLQEEAFWGMSIKLPFASKYLYSI